jgi:hypothetical protein
MKKLISFTFLFVFMFFFCCQAMAATVTLTWNPVDFVKSGSDPAKSGYNTYISYDEGVTITKVPEGTVDNTKATVQFTATTAGHACFYLTAFNQFGESNYSLPACAYVGTKPDDVIDLKVSCE